MSPEQIESFLALALGFAFAGLLATGYQCLTARPASFRLISQNSRLQALAALPFVIFAAPFIIMRNAIRARRITNRRFEFVMLSTIIAGVWSLMCGTFMVMMLHAAGQFLA